jgi:hypothetical protein
MPLSGRGPALEEGLFPSLLFGQAAQSVFYNSAASGKLLFFFLFLRARESMCFSLG